MTEQVDVVGEVPEDDGTVRDAVAAALRELEEAAAALRAVEGLLDDDG